MNHLRRIALLTLALGLVSFAAARAATEHAYIGQNACKKCHLKEYKSWAETKMAKSFELLRAGAAAEAKTKAGLDPKKDYTQDAKCVGCHTNGYGKKGGFVDEATTPTQAGVGCEMCHGAGGAYVADDKMSIKNKNYKLADLLPLGLIAKVGEAQCITCHNEKSPFHVKGEKFDFAARKDKGTHEKIPLKYSH